MTNKKKLLIIGVITILFAILTIWALLPDKEILQGEAEARTVNISSKVPGRVLRILVEKGDTVEKGDVLAELDTPELEAKQQQINAKLEAATAMQEKTFKGSREEAIMIAKNKMNEAKTAYDLCKKTDGRLQNLYQNGVISSQKADESKARLEASFNIYQAAKSAYEMSVKGNRIEDKSIAIAGVNQAKGALEEIDSYLKETKIVAPIAGEVTEVSAEAGELIGSGYPIIVLNDSNKIWATFNVREDYLKNIKKGTKIKADIPALGEKNVPFKISLIAVRGSYATFRATRARGEYDLKTFEVRAVPETKLDGFKPGMSVIVRIK